MTLKGRDFTLSQAKTETISPKQNVQLKQLDLLADLPPPKIKHVSLS